ncbi:PIN domain [Trypanosoma vivax]|uniref:PIN domain-containing protein n=1 Tax=Trypanosoma vivax (strain Y486) TaxID=1055687 RepID=G0TR73_TRYVY|nr:hypothetical protein TRVL_06227 [Trypanosoma vivax]KAH8611364.1 PIN domain [Trypanosoma vivax]CCC46437.1 conserved hypothetical protein [Trypanosoma vivax Y486]
MTQPPENGHTAPTLATAIAALYLPLNARAPLLLSRPPLTLPEKGTSTASYVSTISPEGSCSRPAKALANSTESRESSLNELWALPSRSGACKRGIEKEEFTHSRTQGMGLGVWSRPGVPSEPLETLRIYSRICENSQRLEGCSTGLQNAAESAVGENMGLSMRPNDMLGGNTIGLNAAATVHSTPTLSHYQAQQIVKAEAFAHDKNVAMWHKVAKREHSMCNMKAGEENSEEVKIKKRVIECVGNTLHTSCSLGETNEVVSTHSYGCASHRSSECCLRSQISSLPPSRNEGGVRKVADAYRETMSNNPHSHTDNCVVNQQDIVSRVQEIRQQAEKYRASDKTAATKPPSQRTRKGKTALMGCASAVDSTAHWLTNKCERNIFTHLSWENDCQGQSLHGSYVSECSGAMRNEEDSKQQPSPNIRCDTVSGVMYCRAVSEEVRNEQQPGHGHRREVEENQLHVVMDTCSILGSTPETLSVIMLHTVLCIPVVVIEELDGINKLKRPGRDKKDRERLRFITRQIRERIAQALVHHEKLRLQRRGEVNVAYDQCVKTNDDSILGFAVFLEREEARRVVFVTEDKFLHIKAVSELRGKVHSLCEVMQQLEKLSLK